jgi:hypothetical protein
MSEDKQIVNFLVESLENEFVRLMNENTRLKEILSECCSLIERLLIENPIDELQGEDFNLVLNLLRKQYINLIPYEDIEKEKLSNGKKCAEALRKIMNTFEKYK